MTEHGLHQALQLCEEVLSRPNDQRAAFLDIRCAGNVDLRRAVDALLAEGPVTPGFLEKPAWTPERLWLAAGTRLGPYEVQSLIGTGGMGEVYKARDTRLGRTVAIKLLPAQLAADSGRRRRFEQEAHAVSALNHPHICTLHDVSEHGGGLFLVMEYLAGETLAARLARGSLPIAQAMTIGVEISEALAVAHREGIIHRDLKPSNVMLTKGGAKLLDFGLAKLTGHGDRAGAGELAHGISSGPLTGEGAIVGTVQYMAPEQLEGKPADARTDLWAVGAILYEMVTGHRAFEGTSAASLMGAILEREIVPLAARQPLTPPGLDRLVHQCLAKAADERPDTAHDLGHELRLILEWTALGVLPAGRPTATRIVRAIALTLAGIVGGAAVTSWLWARWRPPVSPPAVVQSELSVWPAEELNGGGVSGGLIPTPGGSRTALTFTPNGRSLIFVGRKGGVQQLYVRALDTGEAHALAGTEGAQVPAVSTDGQWVAFWAPTALKKVPLAGGPVVEVASGIDTPPSGLVWDSHGRLFFGQGAGGRMWQIPRDGTPTPLTVRGGAQRAYIPSSVLPGDRGLLYTGRKRIWTWGDEEVVALDLATGEAKVLLHNAADARYVPTGHLVFLRQGVLWAVPFDAERMALAGPEALVLEGVIQALAGSNTGDFTGAGQLTIAASGSLAWIKGAVTPDPRSLLVSVDLRGRVSSLESPARNYGFRVRVSPDGRRLATTVLTQTDVGLWLYDLGRPGFLTPLRRGGEAVWAVWSPDGRQVVFESVDEGRFSLRSQTADNDSAPPDVLATGRHFTPSSWAPDGDLVGVVNSDALAVATFHKPPGQIKPFRGTADTVRWPEISPDGHWLAYGSNTSGRFRIYVQPYPAAGERVPVSGDGGTSPVWHGGRELFYLSDPDAAGNRHMMAAHFEPGPPPHIVGAPQSLFTFDPRNLGFVCAPVRCYDLAPDGKRFYVIQLVAPPAVPLVTHVNLVVNWFAELRAKAPTNGK